MTNRPINLLDVNDVRMLAMLQLYNGVRKLRDQVTGDLDENSYIGDTVRYDVYDLVGGLLLEIFERAEYTSDELDLGEFAEAIGVWKGDHK